MAKSDRVNTVKRPSEIHVFTITGEVKGAQRWSDTHVSSSGGGGWVGPHGGRVESAQVRSNVVQRGKFFLCENNGTEHEIHSLFGVRDGQRVIAAWGGDVHSKRGHLMGLHNLATGERSIMDREVRRLNASFGGCALAIVALVAAALGALLFGSGLLDLFSGSSDGLLNAHGGLYFLLGGAAMGVAPLVYFLVRSNRRSDWIAAEVKRSLNVALDAAVAVDRGGSAQVAAPADDTPPSNLVPAVMAIGCAVVGLALATQGISAANRPRQDNLVPASKLLPFLPEEIDGARKTYQEEFRKGGASASYCGPAYCFRLMIADGGLAAKTSEVGPFEVKDGCSYEKVRPVDGRRSQEHYDCPQKLLGYTETFDRRMLIGSESNKAPIVALKAAVRAVDAEGVVAASKGYRLQ